MKKINNISNEATPIIYKFNSKDTSIKLNANKIKKYFLKNIFIILKF